MLKPNEHKLEGPVREMGIESLVTPHLRRLVSHTDCEGDNCLHALVVESIERPLIRLVLERTRGNQIRAAQILGINRNTLRKKIQELGIDVGDAKSKKRA